MRRSHLRYLICPRCSGPLELDAAGDDEGDVLETGKLSCVNCRAEFPVVRGVPRFVPVQNYASSFGIEWTHHAKTQYDSFTGLTLTEDRFFGDTGWARGLPGEVVVEVGSGSGRFTEQAARTGAMVISFDYSHAVDANYESNGGKENVLIAQADLYAMPLQPGTADKLFCFGVLQHTPDAHAAFRALLPCLKPGGELVIDVYKKTFTLTVLASKYYVRRFTRNLDPARLYRLTTRWVNAMWPLASVIRRIPRVGPAINWRLLVADYSIQGVNGQLLKEWAYLDTFDMLSPRYDSPQSIATVREWFANSGLVDWSVRYGGTGIVGRGKVARPDLP